MKVIVRGILDAKSQVIPSNARNQGGGVWAELPLLSPVRPRSDGDRLSILLLSYWDLCEIHYQLQQDINATTPHRAISIVHGDNWIHYRYNYLATNETDMAFTTQLASEADVIHINEYHNYRQIRTLAGHPRMVVHHHGVEYRKNWKFLEPLELDAGYTRLVSTFDLLEYSECPETLLWLPSPIRINEIQRMFPHRPKGLKAPWRIAHAATIRANKGTDRFLTACASLQTKGLNIEPILIENRQHAESLWMMSQCDVYFGSLFFDLGAASYEAMAIGMPVLCYTSDYALMEWRKLYPRALPFQYVTADTLEAELERMIVDANHWATMAARGEKHVKKYHDTKVVTKHVVSIYEATVPCKELIKR